MRIWTVLCALAVFAGCDVRTATVDTPAAPVAPFTAPMSPATMTCDAVLASPAAMNFAARWVTGQLRAATLNGRFSGPVPSDADTASALTGFCRANPQAPLAAAIPALSAG